VELKAIPERGTPSRLRLWLDGQEVGRVAERWVTSDVGATWEGGLYRLRPLGGGQGFGIEGVDGPGDGERWEARPARHFKTYFRLSGPGLKRDAILVPAGLIRRRWELRRGGQKLVEVRPRRGHHRGWTARGLGDLHDPRDLFVAGLFAHGLGVSFSAGAAPARVARRRRARLPLCDGVPSSP